MGMRVSRRRVILVTLLASALFLAVYAIWFLGLSTPGMHNLPRPFQSARWKASDGSSSYVRCSMINDLRDTVRLVGRSRAEIVALLGPDETHRIFRYEKPSAAEPRTYVLCPSALNYYVLTLEWRNGRVSAAEVWQT